MDLATADDEGLAVEEEGLFADGEGVADGRFGGGQAAELQRQ